MVERWRIRPWPFRQSREIEDMRRRFEDDFARPIMRAVWEHIPQEMKDWSPSVDIMEQGESFVVDVELPGLKQEDIDVAVTDDTLSVKGQKKGESGVKDEDYNRREIPYGTFYRSVALPSNVDNSRVEATYENGILRIIMPKVTGAKPRKVAVSVKKETG